MREDSSMIDIYKLTDLFNKALELNYIPHVTILKNTGIGKLKTLSCNIYNGDASLLHKIEVKGTDEDTLQDAAIIELIKYIWTQNI